MLDIVAEYATGRRDFREANLSGAALNGAKISCANLQRANLSEACLEGANLNCTDLRNADLTKTNLRNAALRCVLCNCANLTSANLEDARLSEINLKYADASYVNFNNAALTRSNLYGAILIGAQLRRANLFDSNLSGAILDSADLEWANLSWTDLSYTSLTKANLTGTCLDPAKDVPKCDLSELKSDAKYVYGYRTKTSRFATFQYVEGNHYVAPYFSVDIRTECHPGIYFSTLERVRDWYPNAEYVRVKALEAETLKVGIKYRARRIWVLSWQ